MTDEVKLTADERAAKAEYELETLSIQYAGAITAMAGIIQELFSLGEFQDKVWDGSVDVSKWNLRVDSVDDDSFQVIYIGLAEEVVEQIRKQNRWDTH